jgi:photosystem II stability/assembly factor-like uncharacterized protein
MKAMDHRHLATCMGLLGPAFLCLTACSAPKDRFPAVTVKAWSVASVASPAPASLRGISAPGSGVVWASGSQSTVLRSLDGGQNWQVIPAPGEGTLDFRDIHALDRQTAWLMAAGTGQASRVYATTDGGLHWQLQLQNQQPEGFFDSFAFWDENNALLLGDPVDGRFTLYRSRDGGKSWQLLPEHSRPLAQAGEHCYAASGTVLVTAGRSHAWFATGGYQSRVLRTTDGGASWQAAHTPIMQGGAAQGIFSLAFRDQNHGIAIGGDYTDPENGLAVCARTTDGGRSWRLVSEFGPTGYRSGVAHLPGSTPPAWVSLGSHGADYSLDDGLTWQPFADLGRGNAVIFSEGGAGWAVGGADRSLLSIAALAVSAPELE